MSPIRKFVVAVGLVVVLFGAITLLALEGGEVVVLRTRTVDGGWRETRIWVADDDGMPLIEAASEERPFFRDLQRDPRVELERAGATERRIAIVLEPREGHELVRARLRQKYGWKDWWIGWIADTSESRGVRLRGEDEPRGRDAFDRR